ncbi:MAG: hypothetical protein KDI76_13940 [Xanthomonadales bacterium]|nr:hypothetical protein [Xanthomonadales bacterium]
MTKLIITGIVVIILELILTRLKIALFKSLENSGHKDLIESMYLPKNYFKPFKKRAWEPIKYLVLRNHRVLKNKQLSKLCDLTLLVYVLSWITWFYLILLLSVVYWQ